MKKYIPLVILFIIAVLANSQMDVITYNPSRAWFDGWWIASNWQQEWWQKYLLGWTVDGWHFCKIIMMSSITGMFVLLLKFRWWTWFIILVTWGILFEIFYGI